MTAWYESPFLRPFLPEGIYFMRRTFHYFHSLPKKTTSYAASYFALGDLHVAGAMCHVVAEMDETRRLYLAECWHSHVDLDEAAKTLFQIVDAHHRCKVLSASPNSTTVVRPPIGNWFIDPKQDQDAFGTAVSIEEQRLRLAWNKAGAKIDDSPPVAPIRVLEAPFDAKGYARGLQALVASGGLQFPRKASWLPELLDELCLFPAVATSSRVNALALLNAGIREMTAPHKKKPRKDEGGASSWVR